MPVLASVDPWALALSVAAAVAIFRFKIGMIRGKCLADFYPAVEVDHLGEVTWLQALDKIGGGGLKRAQLAVHAGAAVEQQRQGDRLLFPVEVGQVLLDPVFKHAEVFFFKVDDVAAGLVNNCDVQRHDVDAGAERTLGVLGRQQGCGRDGHRDGQKGPVSDSHERRIVSYKTIDNTGLVVRTIHPDGDGCAV